MQHPASAEPTDQPQPRDDVVSTPASAPVAQDEVPEPAPEFGGRGGPDPTRYGDWEKNGRCIDF
ncbi:MAG TPA: DUF1674 domain-containing protein [Luteimonas sp.]|nr:DUF1674 domain-containing protein [Luteimonas sp.]